MTRAQKTVVATAITLLIATWLWPGWYEYSAVVEGKWFWTGHHFALTYRSDQNYPVKIDWGRLIIFDLIIAGMTGAVVTFLARKRPGVRRISGLN